MGISHERLHHILYGKLRMKKEFEELVPYSSNIQQKMTQKQIHHHRLNLSNNNETDFMYHFVDMDETWILNKKTTITVD